MFYDAVKIWFIKNYILKVKKYFKNNESFLVFLNRVKSGLR